MHLIGGPISFAYGLKQYDATSVYASETRADETAAIKSEKHTAFAHFMRAHQNRVYTQAVRLLADQRQAEDVVQDVFIKAFHQGPDLWTDERAPGWLGTVARNLCFNHLTRYRKRYSLFSDQAQTTDEGESTINFADLIEDREELQPANLLEDREVSIALQLAILKLPSHQRVPIVLYHFEQMSYEQIASKLTVPLAKVKTDIHRGRLKLKAILETSDIRQQNGH